MAWVAAAVVGSAVVGGYVANKSAGAQADAANRASDISDAQYQQTREDMAPWRQAGTVALGQLGKGTAAGGDYMRDFNAADFKRDPGYQFRQAEGMAGIEGSAAARGGLLSGGTLKALDRYNQEFASGEYGNAYNRFNADRDRRFNRLSTLAGVGQTATRDVASAGSQNAQQVGSNIMQAGNARASGYVGASNAISGAVGTGANMYQQTQTLNRLFPSGGSGGGSASTPWAGGSSINYDGLG